MADSVSDEVFDGVGDCDSLCVIVALASRLAVGVGVLEREGVRVDDGLRVRLGVIVCVGVTVVAGVTAGVVDKLCVLDGVGEGVPVWLALAVVLPDGDGVSDCVGLNVPLTVAVAVRVTVVESVGVSLPLDVTDAVIDGVIDGVYDAVSVLVALSVVAADVLLSNDGKGAELAELDADATAVKTAVAVVTVDADETGALLTELNRVNEKADEALSVAPREGVGNELARSEPVELSVSIAVPEAEALTDAL